MIANLNVDKDSTGRYDFNISVDVLDIENILKKYIPIPTGMSFIKGSTDPIYDKAELDRYKNTGIKIYDTPQCPFIAPAIIKYILELSLINSHPHSDEIYNNIMLDKCSPIYDVNIHNTNADILLSTLPKSNDGRYSAMYSSIDLNNMLNIIDKIIDKFNMVINNNFRYVYSIDISRDIYIIYRYITIGEYRYNECITHKQLEKEYENELHGDTSCSY